MKQFPPVQGGREREASQAASPTGSNDRVMLQLVVERASEKLKREKWTYVNTNTFTSHETTLARKPFELPCCSENTELTRCQCNHELHIICPDDASHGWKDKEKR